MEFFNEFRKLSAKLKKGIVADDVPIIKDKLAELEEMPLSDEERKFLGILRQELDEAVAGLPQEKKECSLSWFWPVLDCPWDVILFWLQSMIYTFNKQYWWSNLITNDKLVSKEWYWMMVER